MGLGARICCYSIWSFYHMYNGDMWPRAQHLSTIDLPHNPAGGLSVLQALDIEEFGELETLPEWIGNYFTCLEEIRISTCPMLSSLPESIQRLHRVEVGTWYYLSATALHCQTSTKERTATKFLIFQRSYSSNRSSHINRRIAWLADTHVARMLGDIAWERIQLLWNFQEYVQEMESKMTGLKDALINADKPTIETDGDTLMRRQWLNTYKSVAFDMEDTLDELMRNIMVKLDKIVEDEKKLHLLPLSTPTRQYSNKKWRETFVGHRDEIEMVGREREKKEILAKVLQKDGGQESSIIAVVGLGGMGKTTLAKVVYTDKETTIFNVKAWVHVSMVFNLNKIVSAIISQVEGSIPANNADLQFLKSQLDRILHDKLYLIVLDDLWEEGRSELENLVNMLQSGKKGSKIIVTTRSEKVVDTLSTICSPYFHTAGSIKLVGMSNDDCWLIMKPRNMENYQFPGLVDIGKEIAQQCSGVPLVAKAIGYVMQKKCTKEEWLGIKNSNMLDTTKGNDERVLKGLLLSYYHMPSQLKTLFHSHVIDHDYLIQQWIASGFIQDTNGQPLQKVATEYVNELLGMSFLSIYTSPTVPSTRMIFNPTLRLHMHDMVHELARHVAGNEFSYTNGSSNRNTKGDKLDCHYHLVLNQNETSSVYKSLATKIRALHFRGCDTMHLPKQAFSHTLYLRVLDFGGCHVSELPSSVYKLKLLRYLDASSLRISILPKSLNHLLNLQL
uniref:NB-ARC domain-containing protein n=1 Tax=Leersia perrieri TaxID=77586 RepID=A0A0D9VCA0_9ORYZ